MKTHFISIYKEARTGLFMLVDGDFSCRYKTKKEAINTHMLQYVGKQVLYYYGEHMFNKFKDEKHIKRLQKHYKNLGCENLYFITDYGLKNVKVVNYINSINGEQEK